MLCSFMRLTVLFLEKLVRDGIPRADVTGDGQCTVPSCPRYPIPHELLQEEHCQHHEGAQHRLSAPFSER